MEDPLAPFLDLLEDDSNALLQGGFGLREVDDYGRLYEYSSGVADFAPWDGVFESEASALTGEQALEPGPAREPVPEAPVPSVTSELLDDAASRGEASKLPNMGLADTKLRFEVMELLSVFQAVYENKVGVDTPSLLRTCISMCEQIMERYSRVPQVVAMHEQAKVLLQRAESGKAESPFAGSTASASSVRENLKADVKEALDRCDAEESKLPKDSSEGKEVDGVYVVKGLCYCKTHVEREQCEDCGVDYRLLNQVNRERTEEVDDAMKKEQQRLEKLETQRIVVPPAVQETPTPAPTLLEVSDDAEDFQAVAKDLKEELERAREKEEADFLKCFSSFQIS